MKLQNLRFTAAVAFFLVATAVIFGGQRYAYKLSVDKPLARQLKATSGVKRFTLEDKDGRVDLNVTLGRVDNLSETYGYLESVMQKNLGNKTGSISVADNRTKNLESKYLSIHYYVEEAASRGNFAEMKDRIDKALDTGGINADFIVGRDNVFVQMSEGSRNLYSVIPRRDMTPVMALGSMQASR